MKIKLTPELSYLIGLWKTRRTKEGIGIEGGRGIRDIFLREILRLGLTRGNKVQLKENKIFFYNSAYRAFFEETEKNELERFKYRNEYAANFIAGMLDGVGGIKRRGGGTLVYLARATDLDEMLLLRLGFRAMKRKGKVFVKNGEILEFAKPYLKFLKV